MPAPERTVARKPASLSLEEAAAVPLAGLTAWQALTEALQVGAGDRVLVHAASGGVGQLAVQIAVALGAEVIGTASPGNHDLVRSLGATTVLDHGAGPVSEQLADHGGPVDAVLDLIGGEALADAPAQVRDSSRIASIIEADTVLEQGGRYVFVRPDRSHLDELGRLFDDGKLDGDDRPHLRARRHRRRPPPLRGRPPRRQDRRPDLTGAGTELVEPLGAAVLPGRLRFRLREILCLREAPPRAATCGRWVPQVPCAREGSGVVRPGVVGTAGPMRARGAGGGATCGRGYRRSHYSGRRCRCLRFS